MVTGIIVRLIAVFLLYGCSNKSETNQDPIATKLEESWSVDVQHSRGTFPIEDGKKTTPNSKVQNSAKKFRRASETPKIIRGTNGFYLPLKNATVEHVGNKMIIKGSSGDVVAPCDGTVAYVGSTPDTQIPGAQRNMLILQKGNCQVILNGVSDVMNKSMVKKGDIIGKTDTGQIELEINTARPMKVNFEH